MKIGVFDSGIGGKSVANAIIEALPEHTVIYREDTENVPYGSKTPEELFALVLPILESMQLEGCKVIVVACNSVTTTIIDQLRKVLYVPLVGIEPMVKPAAKTTKTGVVAVCATPATLSSERYAYLKKSFAKDVKVLEPDCSDWATMIEENTVNEKRLKATIEEVLVQGADVIVMGCTHYHWIAKDVEKLVAGQAEVIQPEKPVILQLKRVLERLS